jgi:hypothetical protein
MLVASGKRWYALLLEPHATALLPFQLRRIMLKCAAKECRVCDAAWCIS